MAKRIDGKKISQEILAQLSKKIEEIKMQGIEPCLAVIIVGDDPASRVYVNNKKKVCAQIGIKSMEFALAAETSQSELLSLIERLNGDDSVNGILCQLPVPEHLDEKAIINAILPEKDVDAFHPENVGHIMIGDYTYLPCTPAGVMEMLDYCGIEIEGKNCVVVGRSNIVGKPMAMLLLQRNATVTICHSRTKNLAAVTKEADILVSAVGKRNLITADMVKEGSVVIDVAMNRNDEGKLCGDVDFDAAEKKAAFITPVPGGVGPMTIATLMKNTVHAAIAQYNMKQ